MLLNESSICFHGNQACNSNITAVVSCLSVSQSVFGAFHFVYFCLAQPIDKINYAILTAIDARASGCIFLLV